MLIYDEGERLSIVVESSKTERSHGDQYILRRRLSTKYETKDGTSMVLLKKQSNNSALKNYQDPDK